MDKFGLNEKGFKRARYRDVVDSMNSRAKELWGDDINLSSISPLGVIIKITAFFIGNLWELAENIYNSAFKDTAKGVDLDKVAEYIGIRRRNATFARGEVTFLAKSGIIIRDGTIVSRVDGFQYKTIKEVEVIDGSASVEVVALERGPGGNAPGMSIVDCELSEVDEVFNSDEVEGGLDVESDYEFRKRYDISVARVGSSTIASIRATLLNIEDVKDAVIQENTSMVHRDGVPPKSIAPLVWGATDEEVGRAIMDTKSAGIQSFGSTYVDIEDSMGNGHVIGFTRPEELSVSVEVSLVTDSRFPIDGNRLVKGEIIKYIGGLFDGVEYLGLGLGEDVIYTRVISVIHNVPGIIDVPVLNINGSVGNLTVGVKEVAVTSVVTVT